MLIRDVDVEGFGRVDVRLGGGRVVGIGRRLAGRGDVDGRGGALLAGLHDHHVHLAALAAEAESVRVGPADVRDREGLVAALRRGAPGEWVRAVGYHESVAGKLDRRVLDGFVPDRPVRVQHRSGALWVWNSAALRAAGLEDEGDGWFWRQDERLRGYAPPVPLDLRGVGARAAAYGITGFTNADPHPGEGLPDLLSVLPQRLLVMGVGDAPVKFLLDDATLPTPGELAASVAAVRPRPVAVHCVTRVQLLVTLLALDEAGPVEGDRIEHGSVIPTETIDRLRRLGVSVVTQPHFPLERGREYATDVDPDDRAHLYRCRTLAEAGIPVAAGTDAPFGSADPWAVMRAAVERGGGEGVDRRAALALFTGEPALPGRARQVTVGSAADLCLLHVPLTEALDLLSADVVRAVFVGGRRITPQE